MEQALQRARKEENYLVAYPKLKQYRYSFHELQEFSLYEPTNFRVETWIMPEETLIVNTRIRPMTAVIPEWEWLQELRQYVKNKPIYVSDDPMMASVIALILQTTVNSVCPSGFISRKSSKDHFYSQCSRHRSTGRGRAGEANSCSMERCLQLSLKIPSIFLHGTAWITPPGNKGRITSISNEPAHLETLRGIYAYTVNIATQRIFYDGRVPHLSQRAFIRYNSNDDSMGMPIMEEWAAEKEEALAKQLEENNTPQTQNNQQGCTSTQETPPATVTSEAACYYPLMDFQMDDALFQDTNLFTLNNTQTLDLPQQQEENNINGYTTLAATVTPYLTMQDHTPNAEAQQLQLYTTEIAEIEAMLNTPAPNEPPFSPIMDESVITDDFLASLLDDNSTLHECENPSQALDSLFTNIEKIHPPEQK